MSTQLSASPLSAMGAADTAANPVTIQIRDLIYKVAGIFHVGTRLKFLEDRCGRRMQALNIETLRQYYEMLTIHPDRTTELHNLLNEITIGETCFFRNQPQLDAFQKVVLPMIVANKANLPLKHIRIWSAGCSTGEEPYTLAMICLEEALTGVLKNYSFEVIATDLNDRSLARAQEGLYSDYAVRNMPAYYKNKYIASTDGEHHVADAARAKVRFSRVNLLDDTRMLFMKGIDIIFCCNVLIYFDGASKRRVIQHYYNNLLPNSYLFLGHSESLFGINSDFRLVHFPGATAYLKPAQKRTV
jgi:chemotaxis protein methyltransferase CheR